MFTYFQEQLRRRREEEERIAQQNEFLRASLRGSRKLQALQDNHPLASEQRPPAGIDNDAFIADEDVERILGNTQNYPVYYNTKNTKRPRANSKIKSHFHFFFFFCSIAFIGFHH